MQNLVHQIPCHATAVSYDTWHKTVTTTSPSSIQAVRTGAVDASPGDVIEHLSSSPESLLPPPPPGAGAAGGLPETVVHRVSKTGETGYVLLAFRNVSVKGNSGLYSDKVVELLLHARVLSQSLSLHEVEYVTLSVQEAEELCEDEFMMKLATNRAATIAKSVVRVELTCGIKVKPLPFDRSDLEIDADIETVGVGPAVSHMGFAVSRTGSGAISRVPSSGIAHALGSALQEVVDKTFRGGKKDKAPASTPLPPSATAPTSSPAPVPAADEKFARPEEVDKDVLRHFVLGMDEAPESSEKEKALVEELLKCDDQAGRDEALAAMTLEERLTSEQDALVARCLSLEKGAEGSNVMAAVGTNTAAQARAMKGSWIELKSTSPFVSLSMAYTEPEGSESSIALGKAKATLDCSAREAFAYQFAVCGREKTRRSKEGGNPAQFVIKEHTKHDFEWTWVKKMPFPLTNREFLSRGLSFMEPTGDIIFVVEALPDTTTVDYGANLEVVRGKSTGVFRCKPINDDTQCEVTHVQHADAGGFVPERVVVAKIPEVLSGVAEMRELFQRDDAIDGAKRGELAAIINTSKQPYLAVEDKLIAEVGARFASLPAFDKLDSPDHFVHMSSALKEGSSTAIGRATTIVDAPIAEVAAWEMAQMSRENMKGHVAFGGLDRDLKKINDHQNIFHVVYDLSIPTLLPRQFVSRIVWKWDEDKKELTVVADSVEQTDFPERKEYLRASATGMYQYKQEAEVGELPQTKFTYTQQVDLGGVIPKWAQNRQGVGTLMYLSKMRKRFDRSLELDGKKREELVEMIRRHGRDGVEYSEEEEEIVAGGVTWFKAFDRLKSKDVAMRSPQTKGKVAYKKGDSRAWGWCTATVRAR
ncbi:hypothetical protein TeGR_g8854 [Tetraparma gracilis]|uniref:START domain-containing protein n=1 Tax=Tetraparma gracilis TaxID=2962635 RepID=A0ABQ6NB91_9STRA|nr:hypothetical protein TeGR_g8854 [Tetraparma gracilis]